MASYSNLAKLGRVKLPTGTTYALVDVDGRAVITSEFSAEATYVKHDWVWYQDNLYELRGADTFGPAAWPTGEGAPAPWVQITVNDAHKEVIELIKGGIHFRGKTTTSLYDECTTNPITIGGASYTAQEGDLVFVDLSTVASTYAIRTAYAAHVYIKNGALYYITKSAITATENTSITAIAAKLDQLNSDPEFIWNGSAWNTMGSIANGLGDLAFKDSASGTYVKPTGSGSVTVKEYSLENEKLVTTSITGVSGTVGVSKMTAGTAVSVAKAGTAVRYGTADVGSATVYGTANRASTATTVGNANVGTAVTYGNANVGSQVTYGNANVGDAVTVATAGTQVVYGNADVGSAVTYGTANPGTAVTGIAKVDSQKTFTTNGVVASVSGDCLTFANSSTGTVYGVKDATGVSITPAVASNKTLTPAKAADTTRKLTPVGGTTSINPAVTSTTKIYGAVASSTTLTPAVASNTTIYGAVNAPSTQTLTPAVAAPNTQTIVPAVSNGTITPWTESAKTVATAASSATTVATGAVDSNGTGDSVTIGIDISSVSKTVTVGTTTDTVTVK